MDVLSGTASVIAIVQLCESIKKLIVFGKAVQDAPATVLKLFQDLELLGLVVFQARNILYRLAFDELSEKAIQNCEQKVFILLEKVIKAQAIFQSGSYRRRTWASLKISLQANEITSLRVSIEEAKSIIQIIQSNTILDCLNSVDQKQQQALIEIATISQLIKEISPSQSTIVNTSMKIYSIGQTAPFQHPQISTKAQSDDSTYNVPKQAVHSQHDMQLGSTNTKREGAPGHHALPVLLQRRELRASSKATYWTPLFDIHSDLRSFEVTSKVDTDTWTNEDKEHRYLILPGAASKLFGFHRGVVFSAKSSMGWKYTIQTFRLVPDDSMIFEFCKTGNVGGLRALFKRGNASPWDRDAEGRTPLWIAAQALQLEIAKVLLQEGADPNECDWKYNAEPIYGVVKSTTLDVEPKLAMIRILNSHKRNKLDSSTSLQVMGRFIIDYRLQKTSSMPWAERQAAITQLLHTLLADLHPEHHAVAELLFVAVRYCHHGPTLQWILRTMKGEIETTDGRNSVLYEAMGRRLLERDPTSMRLIVMRSKNLHYSVNVGFWTKEKETPTEQAMHDMHVFLLWRNLLVSLDVDIDQFVKDELAVEGGLASKGWNARSLQAVFHLNESVPEMSDATQKFGFLACDRCGDIGVTTGHRLHVDLAWRRRLRTIRLGTETEKAQDFKDATVIATQEIRERDKTRSIKEKFPYRLVCSRACADGVCAAWPFESDGEVDEKSAFTSPFVKDKKEEEKERITKLVTKVIVEVCPTRGMPGAFVD